MVKQQSRGRIEFLYTIAHNSLSLWQDLLFGWQNEPVTRRQNGGNVTKTGTRGSRNWLIGHYRGPVLCRYCELGTDQIMRVFSSTLALVAALWAGQTNAQNSPVVVELFTSQGCSSCPPADAVLAELATRDDVIALALHVDYWDYIGWKDAFAQAKFTERQQNYASFAGERVVYTPQMILGGLDSVIGSDAMALMDGIAAHGAARSAVRLGLTRHGDLLTISAQAVAHVEGPMTVQLIRYTPEQTVDIRSGENAGQSIRYVNVVTSWETIGEWDGNTPLAIDMDLTGTDPAVVIVQKTGPGRIMAAARLR